MTKVKRNIKLTFITLLGLYILLAAFFCYNLFMYGDRWFSDPGNTRVRIDAANTNTIPGNIMDRNHVILAQTIKDTNQEGQTYNYRSYHEDSRYASHVIGAKQYGIGAEVLYVKYLLGYDNNFTEHIYQKAFLEEERGNDVILTIDLELQKYINQVMEGFNGSAVVINPKNGEILAMVSKPSFNPEITEEDLEKESLFNKAVYGQYAPGSIIKVITAASAMQNGPDFEDFIFNCDGVSEFDGFSVSCYNKEAHGDVDLAKAIRVSCNGYFAALSQKLGWKKLLDTGKDFGFNTEFIFPDIILTSSKLPLNKNVSDAELCWTGVGQGNTLVTPLHMAMIASAIANDGVMMQPRLILGVRKRNGVIYSPVKSKKFLTAVEPEIAHKLLKMMQDVVDKGTGVNAKSDKFVAGGKTGTAELKKGEKPHTWFIGFASGDNPAVAISLIIENAGTASETATPIAGKILSEAVRLGYALSD